MSNKERKAHRRRSKQHAINRSRERHGLELTNSDIEAISQMIRENKYEVQVKRSKFIVNYKGHNLYVTYNSKIASVNTILTKDKK